MSDWKPVTIWERWKKDSKDIWSWDFNHIEDGYDPNRIIPTPINEAQRKAWGGAEWNAIEGVLTEQHEVIRRVKVNEIS